MPVTNLVVLEVGLAIGLILLAINKSLLYVGVGFLGAALLIAILRWRGKWFTQWFGLTLRYAFRSHGRSVTPPPPNVEPRQDESVTGPEDARVSLLRLVVPDLVVAHTVDHERAPVGLALHEGTWTAVLLVEPTPALITQADGAPSLPLSGLARCLEDRGVVLDSIQVIWHTYPGSAALPAESPALSSYMEVLGPLPAAARRTTWVAIRLDPRRCSAAVRERGGGVVGAHRALIGALSRVRNALESQGVPTRPLAPDEVLRAGISAAELTAVAGNAARVNLREHWTSATAAGIGHASYAVTSWPRGKITGTLNALTSVRALSATVALSISPSDDEGQIGLRGVVRLSARNPRELDSADERLNTLADRIGVSLTPLRGLQIEGLAATLPMGGTA
ncbi:type VII secretion protein EccE [Amycolatopsis rhizosphaerae]|uniref:Type VII secretion protein EccE n=1 Tax=Amycolatopsis rhizosphaerae TaxID=2053003 RepID=A0A558D7J1_9PSEU|nr:type VII secretion protein EccE [Amycolatopsis rhizosphaerae]TVT56916.1 type VII secretion protein EccE [Amycolatopsis rhizosphaerae]